MRKFLQLAVLCGGLLTAVAPDAASAAGETLLSDLWLAEDTPAFPRGVMTPAFSSTVNSYTVNASYIWTACRVTPTAMNTSATVRVNGVIVPNYSKSQSIPLPVGDTTVTITVSYSSAVNTYTLLITRGPTLPGYLDASFNGYGRRIESVGSWDDHARGVVMQSDDKILVAGYTESATRASMLVARYNRDSTPDFLKETLSFGRPGTKAYAHGVALQSDGKIVVAGYCAFTPADGGGVDFAVARLIGTSGSRDETFGPNGQRTTDIDNGSIDKGNAVVVQPDGKILVAGESERDGDKNIALVRYNANGLLDVTFGTGGKVVTGVGSGVDSASSMALQSDGKIVVAGRTMNGPGYDFVVLRYLADGRLDPGFGTGGKVITSFGPGDDAAYGVAVVDGGRVLVAGETFNGTDTDVAVAQYLPDGTLDASFGTGGKVITVPAYSGGNDSGRSLAVHPNGTFMVGGYSHISILGRHSLIVVKYLPNGSLDASFSTGGVSVVSTNDGQGYAHAVAIQRDSRVVVVGENVRTSESLFVLARLFNPILPEAANAAPTDLTATGATVRGFINPNGAATTATLEYGLTDQYGMTEDITLTADDNGVMQPVSRVLTGLATDTTYHYRFKATNIIGTAYSEDATFFTSSIPSNDASLASLSVTTGTLSPAFSSTVTSYTSTLPYGLTATTVSAEASDERATVTVNGRTRSFLGFTETNIVGSTATLLVKVTAMDGSSQTYTVSLMRPVPGTGDPDFGFGMSGITKPTVGTGSSVANAVVVQGDGKIVAGGASNNGHRMVLTRHLPDGSLDLSFGTGGIVTSALDMMDGARRVKLQPDGKILILGTDLFEDFLFVARFNEDGSADSTFGTAGVATAPIPGTGGYAADFALQGDGKIVAVGSCFDSSWKFLATRFNGNGTTDATFGTAGKVTVQVNGLSSLARAMLPQEDGKFLIGGDVQTGSGPDARLDFGVLRLLSDGTLDSSWGNQGVVLSTVTATQDNHLQCMAMQSDGKVLIAGSVDATTDFRKEGFLARYTHDGARDGTFATQGVYHTASESVDGYAAMAVLPGDRIVTVGTGTVDGNRHNTAVKVFTANGVLSKSVSALRDNIMDVRGMAVQADENLILAGSAGSVYALGRVIYLTPPTLDITVPGNITGNSAVLSGTVNPNGKATEVNFEIKSGTGGGSYVPLLPKSSVGNGTAALPFSVEVDGLLPGTVYQCRLNGTNEMGVSVWSTEITFLTLSGQQHWRQTHFNDPDGGIDGADEKDFDGDGINNLLEWATGLDPREPGVLPVVTEHTGENLEFTYVRSVAAVQDGTTYTVEWSDTMASAASWSSAGVTESVESTYQTDEGTMQVIKALVPAGNNGRRFVHLKVSTQ